MQMVDWQKCQRLGETEMLLRKDMRFGYVAGLDCRSFVFCGCGSWIIIAEMSGFSV